MPGPETQVVILFLFLVAFGLGYAFPSDSWLRAMKSTWVLFGFAVFLTCWFFFFPEPLLDIAVSRSTETDWWISITLLVPELCLFAALAASMGALGARKRQSNIARESAFPVAPLDEDSSSSASVDQDISPKDQR
jgi:hypothetical protein